MYGDRERCLDAGMDDYVTKPVRVEDLGTELERADGVDASCAVGKPARVG